MLEYPHGKTIPRALPVHPNPASFLGYRFLNPSHMTCVAAKLARELSPSANLLNVRTELTHDE